MPLEPQKLEAGSVWAGEGEFYSAVANLLALSTKPAARFVGQFSTDKLRAASEFLMAVVTATEQKEGASKAKAETAG